MATLHTVMFDLDGTLIDSAPAILTGFLAAIEGAGLTPAIAPTTAIIGPPLLDTLALLSGNKDPAVLADLAARFKAYYDDEGLRQTLAYEQAGEVLRTLHERGFALHIATNKRHLALRKIVDQFGWDPYLRSTYALDLPGRQFASKGAMLAAQLADFDIDPASACYVGDRDDDRDAALANGLAFVGAAWGYGDFGQAAPHAVLTKLADLPAWASARS